MLFGIALSSIIPRQSLTESFLSEEKFFRAINIFYQWVTSSIGNTSFIIIVLISAISLPYLFRGKWPNSAGNSMRKIIAGHFTLQVLGIVTITPLFFESDSSLRYLMFPAIVLILSLSLSLSLPRIARAQLKGR
jgi:hypothetical protein